MPGNRSLLIVDDDEDWRDIYARAAAAEGFGIVRTAESLPKAIELIDQIRFSFAFIDIGLDVADDRNTDGMQVMQRIRSLGDETSLIVITGRGGTDVLRIARDALKKYEAQDILSKGHVAPADLREAVRRGVEAFTAESAQRLDQRVEQGLKILHDLISVGPAVGDNKHRINPPYKVARRLLAEWLPIFPEKHRSQPGDNPLPGIAHAVFWSRSIGQPIAIAVSGAADLDRTIKTASSTGIVFDGYPAGELLRRVSWKDLGGAVFAVAGARRDSFSEGAPS
jgi:ActR/RegA family two-component response regulator